MEKNDNSNIGISFIIGIIGAFFLPKSLSNVSFFFGFAEYISANNGDYLLSIISGVIVGSLVVSIPKKSSLKTLMYVFGSLLLMNTVAYFGGTISEIEIIRRWVVTFSILCSGLLIYSINYFLRRKKLNE